MARLMLRAILLTGSKTRVCSTCWAPHHPQTQGIERWHQTLKNRILLEIYPDTRSTRLAGPKTCGADAGSKQHSKRTTSWGPVTASIRHAVRKSTAWESLFSILR
jgi:hypothetical protein